MVLYNEMTPSACGTGQAAMGPFYCPLDQKVYLDLSFFQELDQKFGAPGDFAQAYVIAHEVGHHVQNLTGAAEKVRNAQQRARGKAEANQYSVMLELQADCYAGVWAHDAARACRSPRRHRGRPARRHRHRRRPVAAPDAGRRRAGRVHPWQLGAARALAQGRDGIRRPNACDTFNARQL